MDEQVIKLYQEGNSIRGVSDLTKISATQIRRILKRNGIDRRGNRTNYSIEKEIFEKYKSGINSEQLAKDFKLNPSTVCRIIKRSGGEIRPAEENKRKFEINDSYFEKIDTEDKAYFLGFMYADGSVHKKQNSVKLGLHVQDIDILKKFRDYIFPNKENQPIIGCDRDIYRHLNISNKNIKDSLIKHGCTPAKTFTVTLPNLQKKFMRPFFRGLFDGDGGIHIGKNNRVRVHLTGYYNFLQEVQLYFFNIGILGNLTEVKGKKDVGALSFDSKRFNYKIIKYLYDGSNIHLQRKFNSYKCAIKVLEKTPNKYCQNVLSFKANKLSKKWLEGASLVEKEKASEYVFDYFRLYGFPYPKFEKEELIKDYNSLILNNAVCENNNIKSIKDSGLKIFKHYCPQYFEVSSTSMASMVEAFDDDKKLMEVIKNRMGITYKECFNITGNMIRQGFRNSYKSFCASVFKPSVAKCIYDTYCKPNSHVLDISTGFGQRMLGAAASKRVTKYTGLDPWEKNIDSINLINEEITKFNIDLQNIGSENFSYEEEYDFCFSSPPFYNKEVYTTDKSQAYNNRSFDDFIQRWWVPTSEGVFKSLKKDGLFVLNMDPEMAEVMINKSKFNLQDRVFINFSRKHMKDNSKDCYYILKK